MLGRMRRTRELRSQLFGEMLQRFGLTQRCDYASPDGAMLQIAAARCMHCRTVEQCKLWMAQTTGTEGAEEFCPNAATFAALASRPKH
jgi:hypothetical protein